MTLTDICKKLDTLDEEELLAIRDYAVALNDLKFYQPHFIAVALDSITQLENQDVN